MSSNDDNTDESSSKERTNSSLVILIVDASPLTFGQFEIDRNKPTRDGKKRSSPVVLSEVLESVIAFVSAVKNIERNAAVLVIAVADRESAVVFPRKDVLETWWNAAATTMDGIADSKRIQGDIFTGVTELMERAALKAATNTDHANRIPSIAAACSKALCLVNRCFVAAATGKGISALHSVTTISSSEPILAMAAGTKRQKPKSTSALSPRILVIQASPDRSRDYNALMNCAFSAAKQNVVIDGCFLRSTAHPASSFLEQTCDLTGGIYLAPAGMSQVGGALTGILVSVFLTPLACRGRLNLPALHRVEFKARCFDTDAAVDTAVVCNQCLSIYENPPTTPTCPTCQAKILVRRGV